MNTIGWYYLLEITLGIEAEYFYSQINSKELQVREVLAKASVSSGPADYSVV